MVSEICYYIVRLLIKLYATIRYSPKYVNAQAIPKAGGLILCGNHRHAFDYVISAIAVKRMVHWLAKKELYDSFLGFYCHLTGHIRVDRHGDTTKTKEEIITYLKMDRLVGIYPEGTRNRTKKELLPFKFGAVSSAKKTGKPIIPFAITGEYKFCSKTLTIRFGHPFYVGNKTLEEANNHLKDEILKLINQSRNSEISAKQLL